MKIALLGYGKMGRTIHDLIKERFQDKGLSVEMIVDDEKDSDWEKLTSMDVAIDFSIPSAAKGNIHRCFQANVPIVVGTTGWMDEFDAIKKESIKEDKGFFYASNYSIGVNVFFAVNQRLANLMEPLNYQTAIEEIHHTEKLDKPSGTAITLANGVIAEMDQYNDWVCDEAAEEGKIQITSKREPNVPGTHIVTYSSTVDTIEIKHTAHSRQGFALGAIQAAIFMVGKTGFYTMKDLLKL